MYVKKHYSFYAIFSWSKIPFLFGLIYSILIGIIDYYFINGIALPWQPVGCIGIALAFYLGFKNNVSYTRIRESEQIYGRISDSSYLFCITIASFINADNKKEIVREMFYRHIAWVHAINMMLKEHKRWEHNSKEINEFYTFTSSKLEDFDIKIKSLLSSEEISGYKNKSNIASHILQKQSQRIQELRNEGYLNNFQHMKMQDIIEESCSHQEDIKSIKNFPIPRQYASTAFNLTKIFFIIAPLGILESFVEAHNVYVLWSYPIISATIIWSFYIMEKVGDYSENPFEGGLNDVPIMTLSQEIEINLREMLKEKNIPQPIKEKNAIKEKNGFLY